MKKKDKQLLLRFGPSVFSWRSGVGRVEASRLAPHMGDAVTWERPVSPGGPGGFLVGDVLYTRVGPTDVRDRGAVMVWNYRGTDGTRIAVRGEFNL